MQVSKIYDFEQRSPEWYKIREAKITSSIMHPAMGKITLQKTKDAIKNIAMKLAIESVYGMIEDDYVNFDMQRGIDLEPSALNRISDILGEEFIFVSKVGFIEYNEHIGSSPDGVCSNKRLVEIKCPKIETFMKLVITDEIDEKHFTQMQHQLMCSGMDAVYYMVYCVHQGKEMEYIRVIERDEDYIAEMKERCDMIIDLKMQFIEKLKQFNK